MRTTGCTRGASWRCIPAERLGYQRGLPLTCSRFTMCWMVLSVLRQYIRRRVLSHNTSQSKRPPKRPININFKIPSIVNLQQTIINALFNTHSKNLKYLTFWNLITQLLHAVSKFWSLKSSGFFFGPWVVHKRKTISVYPLRSGWIRELSLIL